MAAVDGAALAARARIEDDPAAARSPATAATRSCRPRCARTRSPRWSDIDEPDARRRPADAGGGGRRPRGARSGRRPARVAGAAAGALLPLPGGRLRVPPRAARAPRGAARGGARRAARRADARAPARRQAGAPAGGSPGLRSRWSWSAPWRCRRRSPTRRCARARSRCAWASCSISTSARRELVAAGYERVEQVEERGQFALRGGLLDMFPATEERAVRVDMFDVEIESLRWFSTFTQRSLGEVAEVEIAPAAELARRAPRAGGDRGAPALPGRWRGSERPDIAELLPVERFGALLDLVGEQHRAPGGRRGGARAGARRPLERRVRGVRRRGRPPPVREPRARSQRRSRERARIWLSALSGDQQIELRAQAADTAARSLAEAEPELEKLVRSGYRTVVAFPRRGEGERAAYNLGRLKATLAGGRTASDAGRQRRSSPRCASPRPRCARASSRPR